MAPIERWIELLASAARRHGAASVAEWPPPSAVRSARSDRAAPGGEVVLWEAVRAGTALAASGLDLLATGPLWRSDGWAAIEVWTDAELCGLHALHRAARLRPAERPAIEGRLAAAIAWHLEHTQPDNATNRPWALHCFLLDGSPEGRIYAETLLHNAEVQGFEDPAAVWIVGDAARELRLATA